MPKLGVYFHVLAVCCSFLVLKGLVMSDVVFFPGDFNSGSVKVVPSSNKGRKFCGVNDSVESFVVPKSVMIDMMEKCENSNVKFECR